MRPFRYERPDDAAAAVALLAVSPEGRYLGGGTNLVDLMRLGVEAPNLLVDISGIVGHEIDDRGDGGVTIGAGVTNSRLAADPRVRRDYPVLSQALLNGASGQLRNLATVGGNLLQRTRCAYFQDVSKPCNKRLPGTGCPARTGEHRNLAVFGHSSQCVATHPSDMAVALVALDATVLVRGPGGERVVALTELHRLPGDEPERDTVLRPGELITSIALAPSPVAANSVYRKVRERRSFAFALVSVAAALQMRDGAVSEVRLAFGGVAHRPWRASVAEAALRGRPASEPAFAAALDAELERAQPLRQNAYKLPMLRRVAVRALSELAEAQ
ncbi:MAG TPA: xanthine dehydrogenase family protein subunit M [Solirubrobacteraceae bacterium]|jgi:xanthine dehydrogenase YagS FAD-binding subunit|nr:xanthine dehydrogenase family protein subunit M [Solirubrobacteraceae bacterium]